MLIDTFGFWKLDASMIHVQCMGTSNWWGKLGVCMMPRCSRSVLPHDDDADTFGSALIDWACVLAMTIATSSHNNGIIDDNVGGGAFTENHKNFNTFLKTFAVPL